MTKIPPPSFNLKQGEINLISLLNSKKIDNIINQQNLTDENINEILKRIEKLEDGMKIIGDALNKINNLNLQSILSQISAKIANIESQMGQITNNIKLIGDAIAEINMKLP